MGSEGPVGRGAPLPRWAAVATEEHVAAPPAGEGARPPVTPAEAVVAASRGSASSLPPPAPRRIARAPRLVVAALLGVLALAGAIGTRSLPDWDQGRWWLLEAGAVVLAVLCGLVAAVSSLGGLAEVRRSKGTRTGGAVAAVGLAVGAVVLVGAAAVGATDWGELDVPAAWDRLQLGRTDDEPDTFEGQAPEGARIIRLEAERGQCWEGPTDASGAEVPCVEPHRTEVVGVVDLDRPAGRTEYPGEEVLVAFARPACADEVRRHPNGPAVADEVLVLVPGERLWRQGDDRVACVLVAAEPVQGRRVG